MIKRLLLVGTLLFFTHLSWSADTELDDTELIVSDVDDQGDSCEEDWLEEARYFVVTSDDSSKIVDDRGRFHDVMCVIKKLLLRKVHSRFANYAPVNTDWRIDEIEAPQFSGIDRALNFVRRQVKTRHKFGSQYINLLWSALAKEGDLCDPTKLAFGHIKKPIVIYFLNPDCRRHIFHRIKARKIGPKTN